MSEYVYLKNTGEIEESIQSLYLNGNLKGLIDLYQECFEKDSYNSFPTSVIKTDDNRNRLHRIRLQKEIDSVLRKIEIFLARFIRDEINKKISLDATEKIIQNIKAEFIKKDGYDDFVEEFKEIIDSYINILNGV